MRNIKIVTQNCTGDRVLCHVHASVAIVQNIKNTKGSTSKSTISLFKSDSGRAIHVTSVDVKDALSAAVSFIGGDKLIFS